MDFFELHLLLMNMGNIEWRLLLNGSFNLIFDSVLLNVNIYENEDGENSYEVLFEVMHFGLRLPGVLSSFGNVRNVFVASWVAMLSVMVSGWRVRSTFPNEQRVDCEGGARVGDSYHGPGMRWNIRRLESKYPHSSHFGRG